MVWRWDDIFRVYRCPYCGRPEKPCFELWKKRRFEKEPAEPLYILQRRIGRSRRRRK
jgi:hypothetical protein